MNKLIYVRFVEKYLLCHSRFTLKNVKISLIKFKTIHTLPMLAAYMIKWNTRNQNMLVHLTNSHNSKIIYIYVRKSKFRK